jgi:hypothetical protein
MTWNGRGHDFNLVDEAYPLFEPWTAAPRIHPARISYYIDPKDRRPDLPLFPGVDWVRAIKLAETDKPAEIDLTDLARADELPVRETRFDCTFTNAGTTDVVQLHGLSYDSEEAVRARMPDVAADGWTAGPCSFGVTERSRPPRSSGVAGSLKNVADITLDLDRMRLDPSRPIDLSGIAADGPVTWHLHSAHGNLTVGPGGSSCLDRRKFRFTLHRPRGSRVVRVAVYVGGKLTLRRRGHDIRTVRIRRVPQGRFTVKIVTTYSSGSRRISTRTYRGCKKGKPRTHRAR